METDAVPEKEDVTDTFSQVEAVKEEASTEVMERIKTGSNKICIRNYLAKKSVMFGQKSCRTIIEMGNVELTELKKSGVQCPSCLHYVFENDCTFMWKTHQIQPRDDCMFMSICLRFSPRFCKQRVASVRSQTFACILFY